MSSTAMFEAKLLITVPHGNIRRADGWCTSGIGLTAPHIAANPEPGSLPQWR